MSGSNSTTTTATQSSPMMTAAQPYLENNIQTATNLYNSGVGGSAYPGSMYTGFSPQTRQGLNSMQWQAMNANGTGFDLGNFMRGITDRGGLTQPQEAAMGKYWNIAQGNDPYASQYMNVYKQAGANSNPALSGYRSFANGGSASAKNLNDWATGANLSNIDPNFQHALDSATSRAADEVNLAMSSAGRYGSNVHQDQLARTVGDLQANALADYYQRGVDRQFNANQAIDANRLSGLSGLGGLYSNATGQQLSALNSGMAARMGGLNAVFGGGQQGYQNMLPAYQASLAPGQTMTSIGAQYENDAANRAKEAYRQWSDQQSAPWNSLLQYNALLQGVGSLGGNGTSTQTTSTPQNWGQTALGLAMMGLSGGF